ncbi:MAG: sialidase family protein [Planctomycetota bacterium]
MRTQPRTLPLVILLALSFLPASSAGPSPEPVPLLANPSFEEGALGDNVPGWTRLGWDGKSHDVDFRLISADGGRTGARKAVIERGSLSWALIEQFVPLEVDTARAAVFIIWMRCDTPIDKVGINLYVTPAGREQGGVHTARTEVQVGSEWKQYRIVLDFGTAVESNQWGGVNLRPMVQLYSPVDRLELDDASLSIVPREEAGLGPIPKRLLEGCLPLSYEVSLLPLTDGAMALFHDTGEAIGVRKSYDAGQSWGLNEPLRTSEGKTLSGWSPTTLRLKSGKIGLFFNRGERELYFTRSDDDGKTWLPARQVNDRGRVARMFNGSATVLSTGRIVGPTYYYLDDWYGRGETNTPGPQTSTYCWLSDDEGETWHHGQEAVLMHDGKRFWFEEGSVVELADGRVLMLARTPVGRLFKSYSSDGAETWSDPEPTPLAAAYAPCASARMPDGNLLAIWNQNSLEEDLIGLRRHRLTCAVSEDDGNTWKHFRNLEGLDDRAFFPDRPLNWDVFSYNHEAPYRQPEDRALYPHVPGPLRCAYPAVAFAGKTAVIAYDYGAAVGVFDQAYVRTRSLPLEWFYENP